MAAHSKAYGEAQHMAEMFRRAGYPDAVAAREYCIDGETDGSNLWTYTVCVYLGEYQPSTVKPFLLRAMEATKTRLGWH